jgi:hypothetical protein
MLTKTAQISFRYEVDKAHSQAQGGLGFVNLCLVYV